MNIASNIFFYGLCRPAVEFYCSLLGFEVTSLVTYAQAQDQGQLPAPAEGPAADLIYRAELCHPCGMKIVAGDTISLLFSGDFVPLGNRDGIIFDIDGLSADEITHIYQAFMAGGAKNNMPLQDTPDGGMKASFIDSFGICWNIKAGPR